MNLSKNRGTIANASSRAERRSVAPTIPRFAGLVVVNLALKLCPAGVIRALARDGDVVDMAFAQARAGDAHELRLLMELGEVSRADIPHRRAQSPGELMHDVSDRALVGHLTLDTLRHQLERVLDVLLEVAVGGTARHRTDRAHPAIGLVGAALP